MRGSVSLLLAALLGAVIYVANFAVWFDREIVQPENFVNSTVAGLGVEESREAMSRLIVDGLVDGFPLFVVVESGLVGLFSELLATDALNVVVVAVGGEVHRRIVTGDQGAVVINLEQYEDVILAPIAALAPGLVDLVPHDWFVSVEILEEGELPDLSTYVANVRRILAVAIFGAAALAITLFNLGLRRGRPLVLIGSAFMFAGAVSGALGPGGRWLAVRSIERPSMEVLVVNAYAEFTRSLTLSAVILVLVGLGLVATGISWSREGEDHRVVSPR